MGKLKYFYEILEKNNYKVTDQRRLVFQTLLENEDKHMTIEEMYQQIIEDSPSIGIATVYRNVQLMDELKILDVLMLNDRCIRYELALNKKDDKHHHLICSNCGEIIEVKEDLEGLIGSIEKTLDQEYGFLVDKNKVDFVGLCKNCRK